MAYKTSLGNFQLIRRQLPCQHLYNVYYLLLESAMEYPLRWPPDPRSNIPRTNWLGVSPGRDRVRRLTDLWNEPATWWYKKKFLYGKILIIGHVNIILTTQFFNGISRNTQSMIAYMILTESVWEFQNNKYIVGYSLTCPISFQGQYITVWMKVMQHQIVRWGVFRVKLSSHCSCFISHKRKRIWHHVRDLVRIVSSYVTIFGT